MARRHQGRQRGQSDWQNRGNMQRNQYDNIGRDRYGSNTGQGGGYGSHNWGRGEDEGERPNWPGEQESRQQYRNRSYGYGGWDQDQGEEYGDQRYGRESGRRYGSQGGSQGMSRYQSGGQSGGYGQNYGDRPERGWGGDEDYENWGDEGGQFGGSRAQRNFEEGNWHRESGQGRGQYGSQGRGQYGGFGQSEYGRSQYGGYDNPQQFQSGQYGGSRSGSSQYGSSRGMGSQGQYSGRGPKGYRRGDERIQEDISEQLTQHPDVDASEIEVKVSNGEVTLTGTVDHREAKRLAEDIAEQVSGVSEVQNQIRVVKTVGAARGQGQDEESTSRSEGRGTTGSDSSKSRSRTATGVGA